jgi:AcrR family transcriptional regulator
MNEVQNMKAVIEKSVDQAPIESLKHRQRREREAAILDLAIRLMATQGYLAMTMDDLAGRLGIATGTLYQHFASKEELVVAVAVRRADEQQVLLDSQDSAEPAIARLEALLRWRCARRFRHEWPDLEAILYVIRSQSRKRPELQARLDEGHAAVARLIDVAKAEGSIRRDIETDVLVDLLKSGVGGSASDRLLAEGRYSPEALTESLVRILLDRVRP